MPTMSSDYAKQYYEANKANLAIKAGKSEYCELCNKHFRHDKKSRHQRSAAHQLYVIKRQYGSSMIDNS